MIHNRMNERPSILNTFITVRLFCVRYDSATCILNDYFNKTLVIAMFVLYFSYPGHINVLDVRHIIVERVYM